MSIGLLAVSRRKLFLTEVFHVSGSSVSTPCVIMGLLDYHEMRGQQY